MSMKSKLNRRQGFTIAEIIIAVAIMAALVAVLMRGLQSSRKSIERDTYRIAMRERAALIKGRIQAARFEGITPSTGLTNISLTSEEKKDPFGENYTFAYDSTANKLKITPATNGKLGKMGIADETFDVDD